jgi:hypothetical protein
MISTVFKKFSIGMVAAVITSLTTAQAAQVLVKELPPPDPLVMLTGPGGGNLAPDFTNSDRPRTMPHTFRSTTGGGFAYVVGRTSPLAGQPNSQAGFITKLSPSGAVVWSKGIPVPGNQGGYVPNDVEFLNGSLYVCGDTSGFGRTERAFVAKLNLEGELQQISFMESQSSRAMGLGVATVAGETWVVVAGDFQGNNLSIREQNNQFGPTTFDNLVGRMDGGSNRDAFVIRFNEQLLAKWGTTLGFNRANDYAGAVAVSTAGEIFLGMNCDNPDVAFSGHRTDEIDDDRKVVTDTNLAGQIMAQGSWTGYNGANGYDLWPGHYSTILRLDAQSGSNAKVQHNAEICFLDSGETGSDSRVCDLVYSGGFLYAYGEFDGYFRPASTTDNSNVTRKATTVAFDKSDLFVGKLNPSNAAWVEYKFITSAEHDLAEELSVSGNDVYISGVVGSTAAISGTTPSPTSSLRHSFYAKLNSSLQYSWAVEPQEDTAENIAIPGFQRHAGIVSLGDRVIISGNYANGAITFGPSGKRKKLRATGTEQVGYFGVLKSDGTFMEEVSLTIVSEFGVPLPFKGVQTVAAGQAVLASVPPKIYENAAGTILNANDPIAISTQAVTQRICTGYQFRSSQVNGTANQVEFVANTDAELTFLWKTEHALEIKTNLPAGLTSQAAGSPEPAVNKHWIEQGKPVIAQIDGAAYTFESGLRYRSTGYIPTGLAVPNGGTSGVLLPWAAFQTRQQVPQFAMVGPATITWQWQKEMSLRVSTTPLVAAGGATTVHGATTITGDGEHWFPPNSIITVTSPPLRDANRLTLQGYDYGTGAISPSSDQSAAGVFTKTFTLNTASSLVWNYGKTPVPQRVTIGDAIGYAGLPAAVANTEPLGITVVADTPPGTSSANAMAWEPLGKRTLPVRPGKYLLEFNNPAVDINNLQSEDNVIAEVTTGYQNTPVPNVTPAATFAAAADATVYQTYIIGSPEVNLDPSTTDNVAWLNAYTLGNTNLSGLALAEGNVSVSATNGYSATDEGTGVLVFTRRTGLAPARGALDAESIFLRVVKNRLWTDAVVKTTATATVGTSIAPPATHDAAVIGHQGHVITPRARYNASLHDNTTLLGPIFPVNAQYTGQEGDELAVTWFNRDTTLSTNWPSRSIVYTVGWPTVTPRIVIASQLGSEGKMSLANGGTEQTIFVSPRYQNLAVYVQNDPTLPGYNPNEEHAFVAQSFLDAGRNAAFALQNSLNVATQDRTFTSLPFVLVQYTETIGSPEVTTPQMAVYAVEWQDATVVDARLPAYNQTYTPQYQVEAGKLLLPPWPLFSLYDAAWPVENVLSNQDVNQISIWKDRKNQAWAVSGDTDLNTEVLGRFYYPLQASFVEPGKKAGESVFLRNDVFYNTIWPANVATLKNGETITHSGGEAFSDGVSTVGLPSIIGMASAQIVYDHYNSPLTQADLKTKWTARVVNPLARQEVTLPIANMPTALQPAGGKVIVDGLLWRFKDLDAGLQQRFYFNSQTGKLGFRGFLNGRTLGDRELTSAPPAINLLQPNIMTPAEKVKVRALSTDAAWTTAVDALFKLTRDPLGSQDTGFSVGLAGTDAAPKLDSLPGLGLAVIANPALADSTAVPPTFTQSYVTIAENNEDSLGAAPISLHVIKLDVAKKFRGAVAPIYPDNVFDEKITLRHSGDFGGNVSDLVFDWYYREEDGTAANPPGVAFPAPPGVPDGSKWTLFGSTRGLNEISFAGASATLLADNLVFARWRHFKEPATATSDYAGAASSRPPVLTSPSVAVDAAYVPQLAEGWIKRVTNGVNAFDARIKDFRNNTAPSTVVSMLQQAGPRWEGNVALNPSKDAIEGYGLIELYQTVLNRAEDLSINLQPGSSGVNTALLNAANRIAQLYTLVGNEAYADAQDPTIGFATTSAQYGNLAPSIFCFQNQMGSLLEEELALLRGGGEIGARPAYNRLLWNFTNGQGEAAYAMNYGITDMNTDGFIDANDAARIFPMAHGDAWGHYTMALRGYANLFRKAHFSWDARSEKYQINGVVLDVDYLDERAFTEAAAARAKAGTEIVDLVYRQKFTDNPAGQWQGYQDTNTDRAWGAFEWAQRAGTGAFFDWAVANALLPSNDSTKDGVQRVDRETVPGLKELASNTAGIQNKLEMADNALNPLGLDSDAIPFDIDPARTTGGTGATHFEQIYERAIASMQNAVRVYDHANGANQLIRRTAAGAEAQRVTVNNQDRDYRNKLIEFFGTPYEGQIGPGKPYPEGYLGPDLYLHMYVDSVRVKDTVPKPPEIYTTRLAGVLGNFVKGGVIESNQSNQTGPLLLPGYTQSVALNWFPNDFAGDSVNFDMNRARFDLKLPVQTTGYAFKAPADWGIRSAPGKLQGALGDILQAEYAVLISKEAYDTYLENLEIRLRGLTARTGLVSDDLALVYAGTGVSAASTTFAAYVKATNAVVKNALDVFKDSGKVVETAIPETFTSIGAVAKGLVEGGVVAATSAAKFGMVGLEVAGITTDQTAKLYDLVATVAKARIARKIEVVEIMRDLETFINTEPALRISLGQNIEKLRTAGDKYRTTLREGLRLIEEREAYNKRIASTTTQMRYEDYMFRVSRNEAIGRFRQAYDAAQRYAFLAAKAYSYELNLPDTHIANATPLINQIMRSRTIGRFEGGATVVSGGGLAEPLAMLKANFDHFKTQMGLNAPSTQTVNFSLRSEMARIGLGSRVVADWRTQLETYRVADLWNFSFSRGGVDYGQIYRRYCRPFAPESAGAQPALVIPFSSTIVAGKNWFGNALTGGDNSYSASSFATKVRSSGLIFKGYNSATMANAPQAYLIPVGMDHMYFSDSPVMGSRAWRVVDQKIPLPLPVTPTNLADPGWLPFTGSATGYFEEIRRYPTFRAFSDASKPSNADVLINNRVVGRSAWNGQWVIIIPSQSIISEAADADAGLDSFIYGSPTAGFTDATAGTANRDGNGVTDIQLLLQTYSVSGN